MRGRKKKSFADLMRTQVWLAEMLRITESKNINQFGDLIDDIDTKKLLYRYAAGDISISKKTLTDIHLRMKQLKPALPDGKSFFLVGPEGSRNTGSNVPLWDALDGSMEEVSSAMVTLDPAIGLQKYDGVPFLTRCSYLIYPIFNTYDPPEHWKNPWPSNFVAERYNNGELEIDIELITFAIAAWRMANFIGEQQRLMNYTMLGLLDRAIPETLDKLYGIMPDKLGHSEPYSVSKNLFGTLKALSLKEIEAAEDAAKDLNYGTPNHPLHNEQLHDYRFIADQVKRSSLHEYLVARNPLPTRPPVQTSTSPLPTAQAAP